MPKPDAHKRHIIYTKAHSNKQSYDEYPLFDQFHLCPRSRYVGGTDNYLCECPSPRTCKGVLMVAKLYGAQYWKNYKEVKGN